MPFRHAAVAPWLAAVLAASVASGGQQLESEPNNDAAGADAIASGQAGDYAFAHITPIGDQDWFRVEGAAAGDLVFAFMDKSGCPNQFPECRGDPRVRAWADDGTTPIANALLPIPDILAGETVPRAGKVFFQLQDQSDNEVIANYQLYQAVVPLADSVAEVEPNNTPATATTIGASLVTGEVAAGDVDYFRFQADNNKILVVIADNDPTRDCTHRGFPVVGCTETDMTLLAGDGTKVLREDRGFANPVNVIQPPYGTPFPPATYYLKVANGGGGTDADYRLVVLASGNAACLKTTGCALFTDGFESGDTSAWSHRQP